MNKPTSPSTAHQHFYFQSMWPRAETSPSRFSLWWNICSPLFFPLDLPSKSVLLTGNSSQRGAVWARVGGVSVSNVWMWFVGWSFSTHTKTKISDFSRVSTNYNKRNLCIELVCQFSGQNYLSTEYLSVVTEPLSTIFPSCQYVNIHRVCPTLFSLNYSVSLLNILPLHIDIFLKGRDYVLNSISLHQQCNLVIKVVACCCQVAKLCQFFETQCTMACQALLSLGFFRQEYWSGSHFLLQGIFLTEGLNLCLLHCKTDSFTSETGSPGHYSKCVKMLLRWILIKQTKNKKEGGVKKHFCKSCRICLS